MKADGGWTKGPWLRDGAFLYAPHDRHSTTGKAPTQEPQG